MAIKQTPAPNRKLVCGKCGLEITRMAIPTQFYDDWICPQHGKLESAWNVHRYREVAPVLRSLAT